MQSAITSQYVIYRTLHFTERTSVGKASLLNVLECSGLGLGLRLSSRGGQSSGDESGEDESKLHDGGGKTEKVGLVVES